MGVTERRSGKGAGQSPEAKLASRRVRVEASDTAREMQKRRFEFEERYGEDLFAYSRAFVERDRRTPGLTEIRGEIIETEAILEPYGHLLATYLSSEPEDQRGEWMENYLRDLISLR